MHKNWYHEQLKQTGYEIIQVEFIQQPNYSELVPCLVVRQKTVRILLYYLADTEGNAPIG